MTPSRLWLIRHGESTGNIADNKAKTIDAETVEVSVRDPDVPLSELGRRQAAAIGASLRAEPRPDLVFSSPYERAHETARIAVRQANLDVEIRCDERLRERDLGLFDGLTGLGIRNRFPGEAARRSWLGKFYYRPPYGESWADVALRVRSVLADVSQQGDRIAFFSHQAVLFVCRYVIEQLSEQQILDVDRQVVFHNGGVTSYAADETGRLRLVEHNALGHLDAAGIPATAGHDSHVEV
ncbi:MAG: histidine phosphatase family protein [Acidothermaceae bacterium]